MFNWLTGLFKSESMCNILREEYNLFYCSHGFYPSHVLLSPSQINRYYNEIEPQLRYQTASGHMMFGHAEIIPARIGPIFFSLDTLIWQSPQGKGAANA